MKTNVRSSSTTSLQLILKGFFQGSPYKDKDNNSNKNITIRVHSSIILSLIIHVLIIMVIMITILMAKLSVSGTQREMLSILSQALGSVAYESSL